MSFKTSLPKNRIKKAAAFCAAMSILFSALLPSMNIISTKAASVTGSLDYNSDIMPVKYYDIEDQSDDEFGTTEKTADGFCYVESDNYVMITGYTGDIKDLIIPDIIDGKKVTSIKERAFAESGIISVIIPSSIKEANDAFLDCESLKKAEFAEGTETVPFGMLDGAASLEKIILPEGITTLGAYCFAGTKTASIELPKTLVNIENHAFSGCSVLTDIYLPEGLNEIGNRAFEGTALKSIKLPSTLKEANEAFMDCESLKKAEFAEGTETVPFGMLDGAASLEKIILPEGITTLGAYCFAGTKTASIELPKTLVNIENHAFSGCSVLTDIYLPEGLNEIGNRAFEGTALKSIKLPSTLKEANDAFMDCESLKKAEFAEGTETVPFSIFNEVDSLEEVVLPESIKHIDKYSFCNCSSLCSITPYNVQPDFYSSSFINCYALKDNRFSVFDMTSTYVSSNAAILNKNGYISYTVYYKLNDQFKDQCTDTEIEIELDPNLEFVSNSVSFTDSKGNFNTYVFDDVNPNLHMSEEDGRKVSVKLSEDAGALRFAVRAKEKGTFDFSTYISTNYNSEPLTFALEKSHVSAPVLSIDVPETTNGHSVNIGGISSVEGDVDIYVDDTLALTITPNKYTGKFTADVPLPDGKDETEYTIYAKSGENETPKNNVLFDSRRVSLKKVIWTKDTDYPDDTVEITDMFTKHVVPIFVIIPDKEMKYEISFSDNSVIESVYISNERANNTYYMQADYNAESDSWIASGFFDPINYINVPDKLIITCVYKDTALPDTTVTVDSETLNSSFNSMISEDDVTDKKTNTDNQNKYALKNENNENVLTVEVAPGLYGFKSINGDAVTKDNIDTKGTRVVYLGKDTDEENKNGMDLFMILESVDESCNDISANSVVSFFTVDSTKVNDMQRKLFGKTILATESNGINTLIKNSTQFSSILLNADYKNLTGGTVFYDDALFGAGMMSLGSDYIGRLGRAGNDGELLYLTEVALFLETFEKLGGGKAFLESCGLDMVLATLIDKFVVKKLVEEFVKEVDDEIEEKEIEKKKNNGGENPIKGGSHHNVPTPDNPSGSNSSGNGSSGSSSSGGSSSEGSSTSTTTPGTTQPNTTTVSTTKGGGSNGSGGGSVFDPTIGIPIGPTEKYEGESDIGIDPSGIIYEAVKSNPVTGAIVTIYYKEPETGKAVLWNAEDYEQQNPLVTDRNGAYAWDVPEGLWKVVCNMEGYDTAESEWMTVLPVRTHVDIAIVSKASPVLSSIVSKNNELYVTFSKYMDITTVTTDNVIVENEHGYTISPVLNNEGDRYADTFVIKGINSKEVTISIDDTLKSYSGVNSTAGLMTYKFNSSIGDINEDGKIDSSDASYVLGVYTLLSTGKKSGLIAEQEKIADVNFDNKIDSKDASAILSYYSYRSTGGKDDILTFLDIKKQ